MYLVITNKVHEMYMELLNKTHFYAKQDSFIHATMDKNDDLNINSSEKRDKRSDRVR